MPVMYTVSDRATQRRIHYPKDLRSFAAALVIDQYRTIIDVTRELGVGRADSPQLGPPGASRPRGPLEVERAEIA